MLIVPPELGAEADAVDTPANGTPVRADGEDRNTHFQQEDTGVSVGGKISFFSPFRPKDEVFNLQKVGELPANPLHLRLGDNFGEFIPHYLH